MILNKKIIRTILEYRSRYLGSIALVFLSCVLYTAFNIGAPSVKVSLEEFNKKNVVEDANFILQNPLQNIGDLEKKYDLVLEQRNSFDSKLKDGSTLRVFKEAFKIDKPDVIEGNYLKEAGDILIDKKYASAHKLKVGDKLNVMDKAYKIAGYITLPDYIFPLKSESDITINPESFGLAVLSEKDYLGLGIGSTFYSVKFNKSNIDDFRNELSKNNMILKWTNKEDNLRIVKIDGNTESFIQVGKTVPIAILVLTCFFIAVVLWRLIKDEFVQIGTLYAVGYRKVEILRHYLVYPLILSFLGGVSGSLVGIVLAKPVIEPMFEIQYHLPNIKYSYDPKVLLVSMLLPFVFLIPTIVIVVMKALMLPPLLLIRGVGNKVKRGVLESILRFNRLNFDSRFKLREITRNVPRTLLMLFGVIFSSALLLFGFATKDSMDNLMKNSFDKMYKYNYAYIFNNVQNEKVDGGETMSFAPFTVDIDGKKSTITIYGIENNCNLIRLMDSKGKTLSFNNTIISKSLAKKLGFEEGQSVNVKSRLNTNSSSVECDKIAEAYVGDFIYMPLDEFNKLCGFPKGSYLELLSAKKLEVDSKKLLSTIEKKEMIEGYDAVIKPVKSMVGIIAVIAFIIGLIVIYVVTSLVIEENKANISLLKILGYNKKKIYALVLNSNTILVVIGYIISIPIIMSLVDQLFIQMLAELNITMPVKLLPINIALGFLIIFVTYEISKLLSRGKVLKIPMADSLKNRLE